MARCKRKWWEFVKKPIVKKPDASVAPIVRDTEFARIYPNLHEACFSRKDLEGKARDPHTIFLCEQEGAWRGLLKARDCHVQAWFESDSLTGLLRAMEVACETGEAGWHDIPEYGRKTKRPKAV